jgi:hypothetical protein
MAFAGARRAKEVERHAAIDEAKPGQRHDAVPIQGGLEGEVELGPSVSMAESRAMTGAS